LEWRLRNGPSLTNPGHGGGGLPAPKQRLKRSGTQSTLADEFGPSNRFVNMLVYPGAQIFQLQL